MGALPQAVGPPALLNIQIPISFEMKRRGKPGTPSAAHSPLTSGNKGMAWTETEHLAFLNGLKAFGRGQWKQISRYYVPSRTPTQVASHAQKHFLRLTGTSKRRSRFATVDDLPTDESPAPAAPRRTHVGAEEQPLAQAHIQAPAAAPAVASTASEGAISSATGASARVGAPMGPSFTQFGGGLSFSLPPPADASGLALGIPLPQPPQLITSPNGTGKLPMLPVQPGRINLNKPHSVSNPAFTHSLHTTQQQQQTFSRGESKPRQQQVQRRETTTAVRRAHMEHARELRERLNATNTTQRARKPYQPHDSHSGSVCSDTTSTPYTAALDALAGVAAALADSAGNF